MMRIHESNLLGRVLCALVCVALLCATTEIRAPAASAALEGARTSEEAARAADTSSSAPPTTLAAWRPTADFLAASAGDTTDVGFPEDEEKETHLYRDIGIFLLVSAFVGYFIVKAFIQGDTEEPPAEKKGKDIPF